MNRRTSLILVSIFIIACVLQVNGQGAAEICGDRAGSSWSTDASVFGKVHLVGFSSTGRLPKITVILDRRGNQQSQTIDRNGHFCFQGVDGGGGTLILELEGKEIIRRSLGATTTFIKQIREDFELQAPDTQQKPPATISAKFVYPRTEANTELFEKAAAAEKAKDLAGAEKLLKEILAADGKDYVALARLGSVQFERNEHKAAETSYKSSLELKPDFSYAMMNLGRIYLVQNKVDDAIKYLEQTTTAEPNSPRGFQLLGEAYLLARKGTLGVESLYRAIELDPIGMAECHLLVARLFDRAGAKGYASREYRIFLEKVPAHADKAKFEKYIKENPEATN